MVDGQHAVLRDRGEKFDVLLVQRMPEPPAGRAAASLAQDETNRLAEDDAARPVALAGLPTHAQATYFAFLLEAWWRRGPSSRCHLWVMLPGRSAGYSLLRPGGRREKAECP